MYNPTFEYQTVKDKGFNSFVRNLPRQMASYSNDAGADASVEHSASSKRSGREQSFRASKHDVTGLLSDVDLNRNSAPRGANVPTESRHHRQKGRSAARDGKTFEMYNSDKRHPQGSTTPKRAHPRQHKIRPHEPLRQLNSSEHINTCCRFIVRSDANLTPSSFNVDKPFNTRQLWRIFAPVQECPICLERPEVPRMLGCGHLMCYHCMIKHKKYSETPGECPICGEVVAMIPSRATPVSFLESDSSLLPRENEEVVLTLMARPAKSTLALPVNLDLSQLQKCGTLPDPSFVLWTRVCQGSREYAAQELAAEVKYLIGASKQSIAENGFDTEGYEEAVNDLKRYIHSLNTTQVSSDSQSASHTRQTSMDGSPASPDHSSSVYFYQTSFESPIVYTLNSLDVSILKAAFGSFDNFPTSLIVKVLNVDFTILDKNSDRRYKYLSHLPEQTPIALMDCDWNGIIDPAVLEKFGTKLRERNTKKQYQIARDVDERQKAHDAIEHQFKIEVAEAMLPHEASNNSTFVAPIDTTQLPRLKKSSVSDEAEDRAKEAAKKALRDSQNEYEELMKHAYVPKKGRRDVVLRF